MSHPCFVVSGTDTGAGKTVFSAALARALDAYYWKPIQAGLEGPTDSEIVMSLSGLPPGRIFAEAYRLRTPASPHIAAKLDGVFINPHRLSPPAPDGPLIIEGAGGLMAPLTRRSLQIETFARWRFPVILCVRNILGCINHSLLSVEALRIRSIPIHGVVFIGEERAEVEETIVEIGAVRRLGRLPYLVPLNRATLSQAFDANFRAGDFQP